MGLQCLQHTATPPAFIKVAPLTSHHKPSLQYTATPLCNTLQHPSLLRRRHPAHHITYTHGTILQRRSTTHCNTPQHTATPLSSPNATSCISHACACIQHRAHIVQTHAYCTTRTKRREQHKAYIHIVHTHLYAAHSTHSVDTCTYRT